VDVSRIKPASSVRGLMSSTFLYLLDERLEVGRMNFVLIEELERMAYRDVETVTLWRTPSWGHLAAGVLFALGGAILMLTLPAEALMVAAFVLGVGLLLFYVGRPGARLFVRVEDPVRSFTIPLGGTRRKQERVLTDLLARVRDAH
jgi:hypothetical protein